MTLGKKWVILVPAVVLAATAFVAWPFLPKRYQSGTTITVVPQRVPESYVPPTATQKIEDRLRSLQAQMLSRTNLERIIRDSDLYPSERKRLPMEDVVEMMRRDVEIQIMGDTFRVAYVSQNPKQAMDVAGRLTSILLNEGMQDRQALAAMTSDFLEDQLANTRRDFAENARKMDLARIEKNAVTVRLLTLEAEVLEASYKSLLAKAEEAKLAVSVERRQIGEQFRILEPSRLPPSRRAQRPTGVLALVTVGASCFRSRASRSRSASRAACWTGSGWLTRNDASNAKSLLVPDFAITAIAAVRRSGLDDGATAASRAMS